MSVPTNSPHPVGKLVARDGCLTFGQRRFWSQDSMKFAGTWVSVRLPGAEDQMVTFWQGNEEKARKYVAHILADMGFADPEAAARAAALRLGFEMARPERQAMKREAEARRASIVRLQARMLVELMHDRGDDMREGLVAILVSKLRHQVQLVKNALGIAGNDVVEGGAHGDLKGSDRFEARLRLAERIFEIGQVGFGGHIESPVADGGDASEAEAGAHRLSGGAK